ncbi:MAG: glycosyltransferase [Proteobacteria bacterium]|nr:glycosyltransferase [Pseudomonadota bacterium]
MPAAKRRSGAITQHLVIMMKMPLAGRVKSRLARDIGTTEATRFFRVACRLTLQRLARQPFWRTYVAITPDAALTSAMLAPHLNRMPQGAGDLGQRMQRPMRILPPGPVCVIGTDIPDISIESVRRAFRELGRNDIVFGPACDGGFWLVGQRRRPRVVEPYNGVSWSSADTLGRVLANLGGRAVGFTNTLRDIDAAIDLSRLQMKPGRLVRT